MESSEDEEIIENYDDFGECKSDSECKEDKMQKEIDSKNEKKNLSNNIIKNNNKNNKKIDINNKNSDLILEGENIIKGDLIKIIMMIMIIIIMRMKEK